MQVLKELYGCHPCFWEITGSTPKSDRECIKDMKKIRLGWIHDVFVCYWLYVETIL